MDPNHDSPGHSTPEELDLEPVIMVQILCAPTVPELIARRIHDDIAAILAGWQYVAYSSVTDLYLPTEQELVEGVNLESDVGAEIDTDERRKEANGPELPQGSSDAENVPRPRLRLNWTSDQQLLTDRAVELLAEKLG